jgi:anti-sigma factor RsiW
MTGQILQFDDSAHRRADALLPWLVNGTLEGDELAAVEEHVRDCARCQREVDLLKQLHALCALDLPVVDAAPSYRALRARIDGPWRGVSSHRLRGLFRHWRRAPRWAQWAIAAEFAGIVALAGWVAAPGGDTAVLYQTLGAPAPRAASTGTIAVVFVPQVSEAELRRIIQTAGARVVDGPNENNAYVLQGPAGNRERMLAALRAEPAVALAEPLTTQPER